MKTSNTTGSIKRDWQIVQIRTTEKVVRNKKVYNRKKDKREFKKRVAYD